VNAASEMDRWGFPRRVAFCFAFVYLVLYLAPFPLDMLPVVNEPVFNAWFSIWQALVPWVGANVFGVAITVEPNGSGDTTFNYVQVFCFLVIAAAVVLVWVIADRRRANYSRLHHWLRIYVRFALAAAMISYGAYKVIQSQFPAPGLGRLIQPFGDASPMGLLWTFMGASASYNLFTGIGEMLGGVLLTMRRTALLGALIAAAVMSNIVMLNFSYDVPVKLYSTHLLLMCVFVMLPDLGRVLRFFVLNRPVEPARLPESFQSRPMRWGSLLVRTAFVAVLIYLPMRQSIDQQKRFESMKTPLHGIWQVDEFAVGDRVVPPLLTEVVRWRRVIFDRGEMGIQYVSDHRIRYRLNLDVKKHVLALTRREDPSKKYSLEYSEPAPDRLVVNGMIEGQNVRATLRKVPAPQFLLVDRGFHWINEYPFNR